MNFDKVYLVTEYSYSDRIVLGVFSTEHLAQMHIETLLKTGYFKDYELEIDTYEIDKVSNNYQ